MSIDKQVGICGQQDTTTQDIARMIELLKARGWYSGNRRYPIEHPTLVIGPVEAFYNTFDKWDESCPYCRRRIQIYKELLK